MTKAELEKQLEEYRDRYIIKCAELASARKSHEVELQNLRNVVKENQYEKWKSDNEVFLKRFLKEYLAEHMWFEQKSDSYSE